MRVQTPFEWNQQSRLLEQRDRSHRLRRDLREAATSRSEYEPHDVVDDEAAIQADVLDAKLEAIEVALERIESGSYGSCTSCNGEIGEQRLTALPTATTCKSCAAKANG
jgi:RNA polymerase-binding transcription factor DksA